MKGWPANKIVMRKRLDLIPYERNPKIHPDAQIEKLCKAIQEWGWTSPILIDEEGGVLAGHGRLFAADQLGIDKVPCMVAEGWSDEQKKAYVIADNKLAEGSIWNQDLLWSELKAISDLEFDVELTGMELDPSTLGFAPNVVPITGMTEVNSEAVQKASEKQSEAIDGISKDQSQGGHEVLCPYCSQAFRVSGV